MLKNTGRRAKSNQEQSNEEKTHFAYENYRKKVKKNIYKDITVFVSVLIIGILIFLGFAKILSPNVDVEIGDNIEYSESEDDITQGSIDERLKHLQAEDEANAAEDSLFTPELDEAVVLPKQVQKTIGDIEDEMANDIHQKEKVEEPAPAVKKQQTEPKEDKKAAVPQPNKEVKAPAPTPAQTTYRVVVGSYASEKQAEVAKSIMQDAGLGVSPIVKNIAGAYTLQVGVFSSKEKAQQSVNNLLKNNFPARIVE